MRCWKTHRRLLREELSAFVIVTIILVVIATQLNYVYASSGQSFDTRSSSSLPRPSLQKFLRIAFVKPVFTATAYKTGGFYAFYSLHKYVPNGTYVTKDLNMLNLSVIESWGWSGGLGTFITSNYARSNNLALGNNSFVISDVDVNKGALFINPTNAQRAYDVVVVGFDEYVTDAEYNQYVKFVQDGGKIVFLDAADFLGRVNYDPATNRIIFVESHGYKFNGTAVGAGVYDYYRNRTANDFGSVFSLFKTGGYQISGATPSLNHPIGQALRQAFGPTVFQSYRPHEENAITNPRDTIIAVWNVTGLKNRNLVIAAYELNHGNGTVIHTGVFGSDIISFDRQMQFFLIKAIFPSSQWEISRLLTGPQFTVGTNESVYESYDSVGVYGNVKADEFSPNGIVFLRIYAQNNSLFEIANSTLRKDGTFAISFPFSMWLSHSGKYTILALYNGSSATASFSVIQGCGNETCDNTSQATALLQYEVYILFLVSGAIVVVVLILRWKAATRKSFINQPLF